MKLIELLVQELKDWPDTTLCYAQDMDGIAYPYKGCYPWFSEWMWVAPYSRGGSLDLGHAEGFILPLASDYATAIITREMWEAACK